MQILFVLHLTIRLVLITTAIEFLVQILERVAAYVRALCNNVKSRHVLNNSGYLANLYKNTLYRKVNAQFMKFNIV